MTSQRLESDFGTTQNQYHLSKTPIFHQIHSKFWLIFGSFWLHFRLIGLLLPHFSLLPQHDKRFVQRLPERCVAVWQQIYENKNFSRTRARQRGHVFPKISADYFPIKWPFTTSALKVHIHSNREPTVCSCLPADFMLFRIQSKNS